MHPKIEFDIISHDTIRSLSSLLFSSENENIPIIKDTAFKGIFLAKLLFSNVNRLCVLNGREKLDNGDVKKIKEWVLQEEKIEFQDDFYRIDLNNYIILFRLYYFKNGIVLLGHFLERTFNSRMMLLEMRNEYLTQQIQQI